MFIKFVTAIIYYTLFRSIPLAIQHSFTVINLIYYGGKIADMSGRATNSLRNKILDYK